jgi:dihydrodiol dehydrogenase / D-xylose 1-dehydrogenase (NADP)
MLTESEEETVVLGTRGRVRICAPGHCPTKVVLTRKAMGRGNSSEQRIFEYPLPSETKEIVEAGGYIYPNSAGLAYEAAAVARCIASGRTEAPQYTWQEMINNTIIMDEFRSQLGVRPITG